MNTKLYRKPIIFVLFFMISFCFGQSSKQKLDSLFENDVNTLFSQGRLKESLALCEKLIKEYEKINDQKGAVKLYVYAANINSNLFDIKKSLQYLDMALEKNANQNNLNVEATIYAELGRNYNIIGFTNEAIENLNKSISVAKNLTIENQNKILVYAYGLRASIYEEQRNFSGLYKDLHQSFNISKNVIIASRLGKYFTVYKKNLDSAKYYLELGNNLSKTREYPIYQISILKRNWGRYYQVTGDYNKAIFLYKESLLISKQLNKPQDQKDTYKLLYEVHKLLGDNSKSSIYLEKYSHINDSINLMTKNLYGIPLENILKEEHANIEKKSNIKTYIIIFIFIFLFAIAWVLYKKKIKIFHKERQVNKIETESLKLKVNESFGELVSLAKGNAPEFLTRFQEVYPDFYEKLTNITPRLLNTELKLCAMLFLGFSAKDIADYTFVTLKAAQHRKFRLRKKLSIPSDYDIIVWINENY